MSIRSLLPALCLCGAAALQACAGDAQPAVAECPDLTGTYEVRIPAWADTLHPFGRRVRMQTTPLATFQRAGSGFTLIWHASRQEFLAAARSLAERDAYRYDVWLDRMLRDPRMPPPGVASEHDWLGRIASVGPVFRGSDEALPLRQCRSGWFLVIGPGRREGPPDVAGGVEGTREFEIWLGRDTNGALGVKVEEHRTFEIARPYRGFSGVSMRVWSSARREESWPIASRQDLSPIRAEELPGRNRPRRPIPKCQITGDHEAAFFQRLKANLPPGAAIENSSLSISSGRVRPDGVCDPTPYTVTVSAPDAAGIARVAQHLRTDPFIRQIDSQESQVLWDGRLMVKFRMMAAP